MASRMHIHLEVAVMKRLATDEKRLPHACTERTAIRGSLVGGRRFSHDSAAIIGRESRVCPTISSRFSFSRLLISNLFDSTGRWVIFRPACLPTPCFLQNVARLSLSFLNGSRNFWEYTDFRQLSQIPRNSSKLM